MQLPDVEPGAINAIMADVLDEAGVHGVACSGEIFGNWSRQGVDVAAAYGLRHDKIYAEVFAARRQLASKAPLEPAHLHHAAGHGNSCWEAQAAQQLLASLPHLEAVSASSGGDMKLPADARCARLPCHAASAACFNRGGEAG